jgi:hypothetical protein
MGSEGVFEPFGALVSGLHLISFLIACSGLPVSWYCFSRVPIRFISGKP